jgi:HD-like signal output (HDOD) protein
VEIEALVRDEKIAWYEAERRVIGVDHAELGAMLAQKWKLTPAVINAIRGHHDLSACDPQHQVLAACLSIANQMCNLSGFYSHPDNRTEVVAETYEVANIDCEKLGKVTAQYFGMRASIDELLNLAK